MCKYICTTKCKNTISVGSYTTVISDYESIHASTNLKDCLNTLCNTLMSKSEAFNLGGDVRVYACATVSY